MKFLYLNIYLYIYFLKIKIIYIFSYYLNYCFYMILGFEKHIINIYNI